jgi:hypothetical protein
MGQERVPEALYVPPPDFRRIPPGHDHIYPMANKRRTGRRGNGIVIGIGPITTLTVEGQSRGRGTGTKTGAADREVMIADVTGVGKAGSCVTVITLETTGRCFPDHVSCFQLRKASW